MIEPFAIIIFNSLLSTRSHSPLFHSVSRTVIRPTRSEFPPNFFIPHARPLKGKEKARVITNVEVSLDMPSRSSFWGERLRNTPPGSKKGRVFSSKESVPRRDRPFRRHPSHHLPHSLDHWPSQVHRSLACQRRDVSGFPPSAQKRNDALQTFRQASNFQDKHFDMVSAWDAYSKVASCEALSSLTNTQLLSFSTGMVTNAERYYGQKDATDTLHLWGRRLLGLLESIQSRTSDHAAEITRGCLLSRTHALLGDLEKAISSARVVSGLLVVDEEEEICAVWKALLQSSMQYRDPVAVLDLVVEEWDFYFRYLISEIAQLQPTPHRKSLRKTAFKLLSAIDNPHILLSERHDRGNTWTVRAGELLIEALCHQRFPRDALAVLEELQKQGITIRPHLYLSLIRGLVRGKALESASRLYFAMDGSLPQGGRFKFFLSTGLYLFAHLGNVERARECFNEIQLTHGWVSEIDQAMMMYAHAVQGKTEEVVKLFDQFFPQPDPGAKKRPKSPTSHHYNIVVFAYARQGDLEGMNTWLEKMSKARIRPDIHVFNMILKTYANRGEVESVAAVMDQMRAAGIAPNHVSYTDVITLFAHRQDPVAAEAIYNRAMQEGIVPDRRMITALMNAHVEAGSWSGVIRSFDYLASSPTRHLRLSIEVYNTLLKAYVLIGAPFAVISNLFVKLEEKTDTRPDMYSFALLIQSACDAGMMDTAVSIFAEMDKRSADPEINMEITTFVYTIIMAGYLRQGNTVRAKEIYDNMCDRGIKPTAITFHMILKTYGNVGTKESVQLAESFVRTLMAPERSERYWDRPTDSRSPALEQIYRPVMIAYTRRDKPEDVVRLYQEMLDAGGDPSLGALTTLLDAYRRSDNIQRVLEVWPQIVQLALDFSQTDIFFEGDNPISNKNTRRRANLLCVPLSIYIDALSTAGLHQEIARAWKALKMHGFTFDSHNWNHLSVALVRAGQPELAFEVVERVILPYQQRSDRMRMSRDRNPDTPLTFANQPDSGSFPEPHSEALLREMERAHRVRKQSSQPVIGLDLKQMKSSDDLAHPLHILQQISPALYVWRPHEYTLRALSHVLMRLQSGLTIQPMSPDVDPDQLEDTPERAMERSKHAREILGRIYKKYPKTIRHVLDFDILADRRLMEMEVNG